MHAELVNLCTALNDLSVTIIGDGNNDFPNSNDGNVVKIRKSDLSKYINNFQKEIRSRDVEELDSEFLILVQGNIAALNSLRTNTVQFINNGNAIHALPAITLTLLYIKENLAPIFGYYIGIDSSLDPQQINQKGKQLTKRIKSIEQRLSEQDEVINEINSIAENLKSANSLANEVKGKIADLNQSYGEISTKINAFDGNLEQSTTQLESINSTLEAVKTLQKSSEDQFANVLKNLNENLDTINPKFQDRISEINQSFSAFLDDSKKQLSSETERLTELEKSAQSTLALANKALAQATTAGLAKSFQDQANILRKQTTIWVRRFRQSLVFAVIIAIIKFGFSIWVLGKDFFNPDQFWYHLGTSLILLSPFIWFGWLSTKQIGNLFRLAEDYQFKASVATSYEGYRKEAATVDPSVEKTLFGSALKRFDEEPLRHVEKVVHGSPFSELLKIWLSRGNDAKKLEPENVKSEASQSESATAT